MAEKESNHSYLVKSVLRSTAVQHAVAGSFTGPGASEVVLAKGTILELVVPAEDGSLVTVCEQSIFSAVLDAQLLPWSDSFRSASLPTSVVGCDLLVLLSDSSDLAFVAFDKEAHRFVSVGRLDLQNEGFSRNQLPALLAVDPAGRAVAVAAAAEHLALFHASPMAGARIMEGALPNASPPGVGHLSWDAIVSMAFVRPSADDTENGVLKLAVIVRRDDTPGHEVLILFHDTRDRSTHLWARLPPSANLCPSSGNFLPLLVFAPPHMSETLLIGRAGDLIALDLNFDGPVVRATWAFDNGLGRSEEPSRKPESLEFGKLDLASDAPRGAGLRIRSVGNRTESGNGTESGWELDLRSPDAETTRVAKRRVREHAGDFSAGDDVTFGDWNDAGAEAAVADQGSSVVKDGPSICAWAWRSDGSGKSEALALGFVDGGLQTLELTRRRGVDGPDWRFVAGGSCDGNPCRRCSAVAWLGGDLVGAFVRGRDGHVMKVGPDREMTAVADVANAAPIVDFQLADHFDEKQDQLFACCGEGPSASLRVIRPGISAERLLSTPPAYKGVAGVWAMRMTARDPHHSFLVMSFVSETRVLSVGLSFDDVTESVGFQQNASTLACGLITDRHVVQICARAVHLCAPTHTAHPSGIDADQPYTATWRPPDGACVSVGAVSTGRVVVGLSRPSGLVMLGVEKRPSDGGYVSLVQLQSCSLGAELSCIALQDAPHADDVSASQRDVSVSRDEVTAGAEPSSEASTSGSRLEKSNEEIFARLRFAAQAGSVCVLGTYRPSVEVRSALPGDGFRLLASVPLAAGTEYQQQNISPGLGMSSDVRKSAVPTAGCVPESLLLSFLDRGYLLVGLRNGLLARYEWPTARLEAALSARGSGSFAPQHSGRGPAEETEEPAGEAGRGTTRPEEAPLETVGGSTSGERGVGQRTSGANRIRPSDRASAGTGLPSLAPSTANGDAAFPITLHQVGERRIGSAPVSLIPLAKPDPSGRIPQNVRCDPDENGRNPDTAGMRLDAAERIPEAAGPALNAVDRTSDGSAPNADAAGTDLDAQDGSRDDSDRIAASVSSAFADVLVLSNQPWLLHRSARGRGRMMTSLLSQPASSHATGVSCRECPRGIVFITDCCMHLAELDANHKTDVRKLSCPGAPRRLLYHPPSKTLIAAGSTPVEIPESSITAGPRPLGSPRRSKSAVHCIDPETGAILCSDAAFPHPSERCVSLSLWPSGAEQYIVVGTARKSGETADDGGIPADSAGHRSLLDPQAEPELRGSLYIYRLRFPNWGSSHRSTSTEEQNDSQWWLVPVTLRNMPGPVLATCQLGIRPYGRSDLAVASGCHVFVFGITSRAGSTSIADGTSRLKLMAKARTRYPIVSLSPAPGPSKSADAYLFVGDSRDGVLLYRFAAGSLDLALADPERRSLADVIAAPGDVRSAAVGADSGGGVGMMSAEGRTVGSKSPEKNLDVKAWFDLGETPTRLRAGSAYTHQPSLPKSPTHAPPPSGEEHQLPGDALPPGKPVFVTTASGGVTSLEKVPPLEYQFLELVQQSLAAFPATAPLMGNGYAAFRARGSKAKGRPMLEADFLAQFLDLTESQQLAVLTARSASLARALCRLLNEESGTETAEDGVIGLESCQRLREIALVLTENL